MVFSSPDKLVSSPEGGPGSPETQTTTDSNVEDKVAETTIKPYTLYLAT